MANLNNDPSNMQECKGCSATVHVTPEEISKLFGETLRVRDVKLTTEEEYVNRMASCQSCDAFQFGTTCRWLAFTNGLIKEVTFPALGCS